MGLGVGQETAHNRVVGWGGVGGRARDSTQLGGGVGVGDRARDSTQQGGGVGWGWG